MHQFLNQLLKTGITTTFPQTASTTLIVAGLTPHSLQGTFLQTGTSSHYIPVQDPLAHSDYTTTTT